MARYTKKPVTVEAEQWTGENLLDICRLTGRCGGELMGDNRTLKIKTLEGTMTVQPGDYIIKGVMGECYPCKPDIFVKTYCEAGDTYDLDHLLELLEAKLEGRLMVVPYEPDIVLKEDLFGILLTAQKGDQS